MSRTFFSLRRRRGFDSRHPAPLTIEDARLARDNSHFKDHSLEPLHTYRGHSDLGGNHRGSIFRKRIREALWKVGEHPNDLTRTWGIRSSASGPVRLAEAPLEREVSAYIGQMPFLWVNVPDAPSPTSDRAYLELNCIAMLSNFERPGVDQPSANWLGLQSSQITIRESGLWNTNHVEKFHDPTFIEKLRAYVGGTVP